MTDDSKPAIGYLSEPKVGFGDNIESNDRLTTTTE